MTTDTQTTITCTDCGDVLAPAAHQQHMAEMHGVMYAPYEKGPASCPKCDEAPCCKMVEAGA